MLMGEFHHTIDTKGRLIIPAKFREELGESFVITRGLDGCLFGYPMVEWHKLEAQLNAMSIAKKANREFTRLLHSAATESELDKQGRINIPKTLTGHAALLKECVLIGVSNRIEIWSEERWSTYAAEAEENFEEIAENLLDFDL